MVRVETSTYSVKTCLTCLFLPLDEAHPTETLRSVWLRNSTWDIKIFTHYQDILYHLNCYVCRDSDRYVNNVFLKWF